MGPKRRTKFNEEYTREFPSIKRGRTEFEATCVLCNASFSISHGGRNDIACHIATMKHVNAAARCPPSTEQQTSFCASNRSEAHEVAIAEATFAFHTVKHRQLYNSATCTSKLMSEMSGDSKIAETFSSLETKTEAVVNNVISPCIQSDLKESLDKCGYVGVSTDTSNHNYHKILPVIVQYFDKEEGVQSKLLELVELQNENADTVSEYLHSVVVRHGIDGKISSFGGDNTNTNFEGLARKGKNNVLTKFQCKLGRTIVGVGCPAHILHNSIQAGADHLSIDVYSIIEKVYNYFSIYAVRVASLKEYCEFVNATYHDLLNHVKTRWLSLFPAIERFLQMFEPLKYYFLSLDKCPVHLQSFFSDEAGEAYFWFLRSQMSLFQIAISRIERKDISVNEVRMILEGVIKTLNERHSQAFISSKVKTLLADVPETRAVKIRNECMSCYEETISYLSKWSESLSELKHFDWLLLERSVSWEEVECTSLWLQKNSYCEIDEARLFDQLTKLQSFLTENLTDSDLDSLAHKRWVLFFKSCVSEEQYYELLKIVQFYFSLPGHNANVERVLSLMNAQWTDERNRLALPSLSAILDIQYNMANVSCSDFYKLMSSEEKSKYLDQIHTPEEYSWCKKPKTEGELTYETTVIC
ncbi:uncharacterized protein LOC121924195 [Sceloporus undulatus]|uniref:uncharacterized protein LOC121924195 n=1 Tax=Sceloporus undulatus TaxID=8520 RepID=UPI001C4CA245|nr:uncharacterized protein LOC121924195 [Sceloporus undulatus]XP_042311325.1 uncharacterized protein LOC121924195 [Sceloporus undulatus]